MKTPLRTSVQLAHRESGPVVLTLGRAGLASLLVPGQALADVALPLAFTTVPLLPIIVILEALLFRLAAARLFKTKLRFGKLASVVLLSNITTALLGIPLTFYKDTLVNLLALGIAFVLSVFIEWGIYVPFFRKENISGFRLLVISFFANVISYALLIPLIPGVLVHP